MNEITLLTLEKISPYLNILIGPFLLFASFLYTSDFIKKYRKKYPGYYLPARIPLPSSVILLLAFCGVIFGVLLIWKILTGR
ncbi:MAG: hypothetical protein WC045_00425 [Patescibacteria group bacterium]